LDREGFGKVTVGCVACWAIMRTRNDDGTTLVEIFGNNSVEPIWSTTLQPHQSFTISNPGYTGRDGDGGNSYYMHIRRGAQVTILCCSAVVGTWTTPYNYGRSVDRISASITFQRFAAIYEGPSMVHVIEGCEVVWTGCGALATLWGTPNALVRTCKNTGYIPPDTINAAFDETNPNCPNRMPYPSPYGGTAYADCPCEDVDGWIGKQTRSSGSCRSKFLWVDLITGKTGDYIDNTYKYTGTFYGVFPDCLYDQVMEALDLTCWQDAASPPPAHIFPGQSRFSFDASSFGINIDPNELGQSQTVLGTIYFNIKGQPVPTSAENDSEMHCYLKNNVTGDMKFITKFLVPMGATATLTFFIFLLLSSANLNILDRNLKELSTMF